jgi:branched-subunit amino acid transport protein
MTALIASLGAAVATYVLRVLLITLVPASHLPAGVRRFLPYVGPAVLAALVATALFPPSAVQPAFLVAAALTAVAARRGGNLVVATAVGLGAVALWQLFWPIVPGS